MRVIYVFPDKSEDPGWVLGSYIRFWRYDAFSLERACRDGLEGW